MKLRIIDKRPDMDEILVEISDGDRCVSIHVAAVGGETSNETSLQVEINNSTRVFDEPDVGNYDPDLIGDDFEVEV